MLSKLFRSRQSTTSRVPRFQSQPTPDQSTSPKPPSKLVKNLKKLQKALRPSRLNRKADDQAGQRSRRSHKSNPSDESWGKVALGPFRAEDYEFRHGSPIFTPEDLEPSLGSTEWPLGGGAPSTAQRSASPQPTKPPSTQFAPTFTTLANASALSQRLLPTSQVEAEVLAVRKIQRDKAQDVQATRSRHTHGSVPQTTSITQPPTREVATRQPIEEHLMPEAETRAKTNKQQIKGRNKWWEMGGNLKSTKRHFRREAVDYGNPNSDYCNVEEFWEKARSLKRGGANKWRQPPPKHNSSKQVHGSKRASENQSIPGQQTLEPAPFSTATDAFKYHGRTLSSTSTGAAQAPLATARQPLGSLDLNILLDVEAPASLQAAALRIRMVWTAPPRKMESKIQTPRLPCGSAE